MPILESKLNPRAADFQQNAEKMRLIVNDLREKVAKNTLGGGEATRQKHVARGKLLPRDRIDLLIDEMHIRFPIFAAQNALLHAIENLTNECGSFVSPCWGNGVSGTRFIIGLHHKTGFFKFSDRFFTFRPRNNRITFPVDQHDF